MEGWLLDEARKRLLLSAWYLAAKRSGMVLETGPVEKVIHPQ